jgi:hypothetical protein
MIGYYYSYKRVISNKIHGGAKIHKNSKVIDTKKVKNRLASVITLGVN